MMPRRNRCPSIARYCIGLVAICLIIVGCAPGVPVGDPALMQVPEEEFRLMLGQSPELHDVLSYATELGYTSSIQSIVEYAVSPDYSLYRGVVFTPDGDAAFIIVDQRPQPFFLPAFLVTAENENIIRPMSPMTAKYGLLPSRTSSSSGCAVFGEKGVEPPQPAFPRICPHEGRPT